MKWIIHKHMLQPSTLLHLAKSATILSAQAQGEYIYLWEMHDPSDDSREKRAFIIKPTGEEFENPPEGYVLKYVSTVQMAKRNTISSEISFLQWHVFEVARVVMLT